jgi:hypothetical protein
VIILVSIKQVDKAKLRRLILKLSFLNDYCFQTTLFEVQTSLKYNLLSQVQKDNSKLLETQTLFVFLPKALVFNSLLSFLT